jgi:hypothetical protein
MYCEDWVRFSQDRDQWRTLVNAVMNLLAAQNCGNVITIELLASKEKDLLCITSWLFHTLIMH